MAIRPFISQESATAGKVGRYATHHHVIHITKQLDETLEGQVTTRDQFNQVTKMPW
jgi:hypothetical protein